jgi:two-component system, sensor histidine kinase and response regulator
MQDIAMNKISFEGLENSKLLIVDDIIDNIRIIASLLKSKGILVTPATSGEQALGLAVAKKPDLILLDVQMPEMDGFEVCKKLKENPLTKDIPVIFLTARTETEDIMKGFNLGAIDYITKPINSDEVVARIKTHLELKKSKDIISEQNKNLSELNATKDKFFSIIAHDLKNPISNFRDLTKVLVENFTNLSDNDKVEYLTMMNISSERLFALLENLLEWSRSQRGLIQFNPVQLDLNYLIDNVISLMVSAATKKEINIAKNVPDEISLIADVNMLNTVIRNIVSNSIKFTEVKGCINIGAKNFDNYVEIFIEDTGIGISAENISKLFNIDSNISTLGTSNEKGTGIGLILCKEFVEKHNGKIWVESEINKGTKFTFVIPK